MSKKFQVVIEFTHEDNRDDFLAWLSDGGGEYSFMEGQYGEYPPIERFDYSKAFPAWGWNGTEPPVVVCQTEEEMS